MLRHTFTEPSPIVSPTGEDEIDRDDGLSATDGMVEYSAASPLGFHVVDGFGESATFHFALTMTASRDLGTGIGPKIDTISPIPPHSGHQGRDQSEGMINISSTHTRLEEHILDQDTETALKSYINQSSLENLPRRDIATSLIDKYFNVIHPIWPFLAEETVRHDFEKTWTASEVPSEIWMAQLNLVFALACQLYDSDDAAPLANVYEAGKMFYLRAYGFIVANCHSLYSISMVQTLLLATQYQQGTTRSTECWLTIGFASRMALGLGLHIDKSTDPSISPLDRDICKRLWWGCFSLDRYGPLSIAPDSLLPRR